MSADLHRRTLISLPLLGGLVLASRRAGAAEVLTAPIRDGAADFDFLIGDWTAHLRKRLNPLTGSTTWLEYAGTSRTRKLLGGPANLEEFDVATADGKAKIQGQTLRLYNAKSRQWSIWLMNVAAGTLTGPPTVGDFRNGRGEFYDQEEFGGRMILVRYVWESAPPRRCVMTQSFSPDGGQSWEPNWVCELTRA
jgi:hypothetical protein